MVVVVPFKVLVPLRDAVEWHLLIHILTVTLLLLPPIYTLEVCTVFKATHNVSLERRRVVMYGATIHHNGRDGMYADNEGSLVELRGEQTKIHHSGQVGLVADSNATINIYIPSRSITALVHDNRRDLYTYDGGKIQSQLSSSSLELTVIHPVAQ